VERIKKAILLITFFLCALPVLATTPNNFSLLNISPQIALPIGIKIWFNECGGRIDGLTSWNDGERFASLGIGHFIWFPYPKTASFDDAFPRLIKYMQTRGVAVPYWLRGTSNRYCPWKTRTEFIHAQYSPQMIELRDFLRATIAIQAEYISFHLEEILPKMLASVPSQERYYIYQNFYNVARTPNGIYALVDYLNFKGDGIDYSTQHSVRGCGLLEVLAGMNFAPHYLSPIQAFVWSAKNALTRRVANAPSYSHENKWLTGWFKRLNTYLMTDFAANQGIIMR
jgi:hypothetical protein